jgi:NADH:ubiquinone oxidoreductase subunit E
LGTAEQEAALRKVVDELRDVQGATMPALQRAQVIYGFLPKGVMQFIAEKFDVPFDEVYGIATFYSQFSLTPKGKYCVSVCLGTACYVKGSGLLLERLEKLLGVKTGQTTADGIYSLDATRCIGCCGLAPVMTVNEDVYGKAEPEKLANIIEMYK